MTNGNWEADPVFVAGIEEGKARTTKDVLSFLQEKYMDKSFARGSDRAEAILEVTRELSAHLNGK